MVEVDKSLRLLRNIIFILASIATVNESIKKDLLESIKKFLDDNLD
jgi:hypothetical protein